MVIWFFVCIIEQAFILFQWIWQMLKKNKKNTHIIIETSEKLECVNTKSFVSLNILSKK